MKAEYSLEDFARGVRNPYYDQLVTKVEVHIRNEDYELFKKIAKEDDLTVSSVILRSLARCAELLRTDDDD